MRHFELAEPSTLSTKACAFQSDGESEIIAGGTALMIGK